MFFLATLLRGCTIFILSASAVCCGDAQMLLDTRATAAAVKHLSRPLKSSADIAQRHREAQQVRGQISDFIVRQLEQAPFISQRLLETQLRKIIGPEPWDSRDDCDSPTKVFTLDPGRQTTRRQVVVAYSLDSGFMGPRGITTVLESYLWENGKALRTAQGGSELDGYTLHVQEASWFTDEYWILAWGQVIGQNGRCIGGKAIVYRVAIDSIEPSWQSSPAVCGLTAQRNSIGWEVDYGDKKLVYWDDPHPRYFDVYSIDYQKRTVDRVIRKQY